MRERNDGVRAGPLLQRASGPQDVLGVVLAGGRSSRMGREKAFMTLAGSPLLAHVLARFAPQVGDLVINANGDPARFAVFGHPVISDGPPGSAGPLSGIAAGLRAARERGLAFLATCPSDAPFLAPDFVERLADGLDGFAAACLSGPSGLEPLFGLWRSECLPIVEATLAEGRCAVRDALERVGYAAVPAESAEDLANLNTPADLAAAEAGAIPGGGR